MKNREIAQIGKNNWICTDPDNLQYANELSKKVFEIKQFKREDFPLQFNSIIKDPYNIDAYIDINKYWVFDTICVSEYNYESLYDLVCHYYSFSEMEELIKNEEYMILAECIFEQENELY